MTSELFVKTYYPLALKSEKDTGISAAFTMAQASLESGWGTQVTGDFNFFGIKADPSWKGESKLKTTHEVVHGKTITILDHFRSYPDAAAGFTDHAQFFLTNKRYSEALLVKSDPNLFADEIAKAGYATDPTYAKTLRSVIKSVEKRWQP